MKTLKPSPATALPFTDRFRKDAHQLIAWGFEKAKPQIKTNDEEEITGIIYDCINDLLRSGSEEWFKNYTAKNEAPFSTGELFGKSRRKIDILIEWVAITYRPEYIFEAKPLNYSKRYQRTGNYTNNKGMYRFIQGEYAEHTARYPEIGMLGYVLSDTPEVWHTRLVKAISSKQKMLKIISSQRVVAVIEAFPLEWVSEHTRDSCDRPLTVYHILLDCRQ